LGNRKKEMTKHNKVTKRKRRRLETVCSRLREAADVLEIHSSEAAMKVLDSATLG
jgi:hypothetical protein